MMKSFFWTVLMIALVLGVMNNAVVMAAQEETMEPPNALAIFEQSRIAKHRNLFEQNFDGPVNEQMVVWYYDPNCPYEIDFSGVTEEEAFSGKHSYKVQVTFEPGKWGSVYVRLPIEIPVWSDLKLTWRIKTVVSGQRQIRLFHGLSNGDLEAGQSGNTARGKGTKTGEENGWEAWEASLRFDQSVGVYAEGPSLCVQVEPADEPVTVTFYVDDIIIEGRLPSDWKRRWTNVYRYLTVQGEQDKRADAAHRLGTLKAWQTELENRYGVLSSLDDATPLLRDQYKAVVSRARQVLDTAAPLVAAVQQGLADQNTKFSVDIHAPELLLMEARYYVDIAEAYPSYAGMHNESDFLTFTLDPTQSYPILPTGPDAHRQEMSYYNWDQGLEGYQGTFENPQVLPDSKPVPARPSRTLANFGCRGTYIPYSFAVYAGKDLDHLTFSVSDLVSGQDRIPASQADIRIVAPWYRPWGGKPRLMNELLLHDPQFVEPLPDEQRNRYKDPIYGEDAHTLQPVTIEADTTRQFYLLVKVPDETPEGIYKGTVTATGRDGTSFSLSLTLEVLPFDLEPTPYAYSVFYRCFIRDDNFKKEQGIHNQFKTASQMEAEFVNMAEHGMNTLNLEGGHIKKTAEGWDLSSLDLCLSAAQRAGLTRSPFLWVSHNLYFSPYTGSGRPERPRTKEDMIAFIQDYVPMINEFCDSKGYPRPAFFGPDEAHGEALIAVKEGFEAANDAGGIITGACYSDYYSGVGTAMTLPILYGGVTSPQAERAVRATQAAGQEVWIYNTPCTNMTASPSVYRRRYGLAIWKNQENGAAPWEYCGAGAKTEQFYLFNYEEDLYAFVFPTWSGKPVDTVIYEAYREGIYDTRYVTTLETHLKAAKETGASPDLVAKIENWLQTFSVHEDLRKVRRQMARYTTDLIAQQN